MSITPSLAVVVPAFNEAHSIKKVLAELKRYGHHQLIVVDDGSQDTTANIVRQDPSVVLLSLAANLGAWKAMQTGIRYAYQQGFDYVVTFDADGQHQAQSITQLVEAIEHTDNDVIIGSCTQRGSTLRHIAWALFRRLSGINIDDLTSGLRIYNRAAMAVLSTREASLLEYQDVGVLLMLKVFGLRFAETPVAMCARQDGISRIFYSWQAVAYYMMHTTLLCLSKVRKSNELSYQAQLAQHANHSQPINKNQP